MLEIKKRGKGVPMPGNAQGRARAPQLIQPRFMRKLREEMRPIYDPTTHQRWCLALRQILVPQVDKERKLTDSGCTTSLPPDISPLAHPILEVHSGPTF